MIGISASLIWSKTLMELLFNPCDKFRLSPEGPVGQIHSTHLLVVAPGIFSANTSTATTPEDVSHSRGQNVERKES